MKGKMIGGQKWHQARGNADRGDASVGHHWGMIGLISFSAGLGRSLGWPILRRLIPGHLPPFLWMVDPAGGILQATFWDAVLPLGVPLSEGLKQAPGRGVAEASFSKAPFIQPLLERNIHVIPRLRKDAGGWDDRGRGRPPQRGKKWKSATLLPHFPPETISAFLSGETVPLSGVVREVWLRALKQKGRGGVVEGIKEPRIFLSPALSLSAAQILELYGARFSIEGALRVLKGDLGLGDYHCPTFQAMVRFGHLACTAFCLFRRILLKEAPPSLDAQAEPQRSPKQGALSLAPLRPRFPRFAFQRILFSKSAPEADLKKGDPKMEQLLRIAS